MKTILILVLLALSANAFEDQECMFAGMAAAYQLVPEVLKVNEDDAYDLFSFVKNNFALINQTLASCGVVLPSIEVDLDDDEFSLVKAGVSNLYYLAEEIFAEYQSNGASESLAQSVMQLVKVNLFNTLGQVSYVLRTVKVDNKQMFDLPTNFSSLTDLQYNVSAVQKCYGSVVSVKNQALPLVPQVLKFDFQSIYMEIAMITMHLAQVKQECQVAYDSVEFSAYRTQLSNWWRGLKLEINLNWRQQRENWKREGKYKKDEQGPSDMFVQ